MLSGKSLSPVPSRISTDIECSALAALDNDNDNAGEAGSQPVAADESATTAEAKPSE